MWRRYLLKSTCRVLENQAEISQVEKAKGKSAKMDQEGSEAPESISLEVQTRPI